MMSLSKVRSPTSQAVASDIMCHDVNTFIVLYQ